MSQNICLTSFDFWNYDQHTIPTLQQVNVDYFHIRVRGFINNNLFSKMMNNLSCFFLNKNVKFIQLQKIILETLKKKGFQNQILFTNPELIGLDSYVNCFKNSIPIKHYLNQKKSI
jgi:pantothenate kinase type III